MYACPLSPDSFIFVNSITVNTTFLVAQANAGVKWPLTSTFQAQLDPSANPEGSIVTVNTQNSCFSPLPTRSLSKSSAFRTQSLGYCIKLLASLPSQQSELNIKQQSGYLPYKTFQRQPHFTSREGSDAGHLFEIILLPLASLLYHFHFSDFLCLCCWLPLLVPQPALISLVSSLLQTH